MPAYDVIVVGAGAAGLFAGIWARRANPACSVLLLDGAKKLGAKILVSGGGRCNVTHDQIDESAYAGSSRNAIRKVLRRFDVPQTIAFFREIGVELKREPTGKLFPLSDDAHTVLDALLGTARAHGVLLRHPHRVAAVERAANGGFRVVADGGETLHAARVILATGGRALPRSGSDGGGYAMARALGHTVTRRVFPALVPLTLPRDHFVCGLSGIATHATLDVRAATGKRLASFTNAALCTHFGLSGPGVLDVSRYYTDAKLDDPATTLTINWLPDHTPETVERELLMLGKTSITRWLSDALPERLARALCAEAGIVPGMTGEMLTREARKALAHTIAALPLPVTGDRGFTYAEVTAGGVPLSEIRLETMESRLCPNLYLCGELCDVDGRIGGYNFQWAWASGYVAGNAAANTTVNIS